MSPHLKELLTPNPPKYQATMKQVESLQRKLGCTLPQEFVDLVLYIDEGHLNNVCCFSKRRQCFDFNAVGKCHYKYAGTSIFSAYQDYFRNDFPGIVPIGQEGNGDSICLDFRHNPERPTVLKHDHEIGYCTKFPFYYLARDFAELLDRAHIDRRSHYETTDDATTQQELNSRLGYMDDLSIDRRVRDSKYGR